MDYKLIIKSQLQGFNKFTPMAEGDYAIVLDAPEKKFREDDVVKVEKIVGEFAYANKFLRSKAGWVSLDNLEKIKMVQSLSETSDEKGMIPIRVQEVTTLSRFSSELFQYFGERSQKIFGNEFVKLNEEGIKIPILNPKIVIGDFLAPLGAEGFVTMKGEDAGVVYVNSEAKSSVDEIVAHEFSHIISFYSKKLAEDLGRPELQLGIADEHYSGPTEKMFSLEKEINNLQNALSQGEVPKDKQKEVLKLIEEKKETLESIKMSPDEMDEVGSREEGKRQQEELSGLNEQEAQKLKSEQYFLKPSEMFAHAEQMLYITEKLKNIDIRHIEIDDSMSPEEKEQAINEIKSRRPDYYKRPVMRRLVPAMAEKYKIKDFTIRKIYESIFDNIDNYIPNIPRA